MRKNLLFLLGIFFTVPTMFNIFWFHYTLGDAFWRFVRMPFVATRWTPEFSESGFSKIQEGMNEKDVVRILGYPLGKISYETSILWDYSVGETIGDDYDRRRIYFNLNGTVIGTERSLYID